MCRIFLLLLFSITLLSCEKKSGGQIFDVRITLKIQDKESNLYKLTDNFDMYRFVNGHKNYYNEYQNEGMFEIVGELLEVSPARGITYIKFSETDTDTLYCEHKDVAKGDNTCVITSKVEYNGKLVYETTDKYADRTITITKE
jgi:hypothetical protein